MTKGQRTRRFYKRVRAAHPWWSAKRSRRYRAAWLEVVAEFKRRSRAAKKGARTKAAAQELQQIQETAGRDREEWEITIRYTKARKKTIGLTCRVVGPAGTTREVALLVAKRAGQGHVEHGYKVHFINWQKGNKAYDYGDDLAGLQFPGFTALFAAADVRAERVRGDRDD